MTVCPPRSQLRDTFVTLADSRRSKMTRQMGRRWKRQILLFLFAVVVPAAVLVTLTVRLVRQEAELGAKRVEAARRDAADQLRRELSARLDVIKASFASLPPSNPAIVFVA